MEGRKGKEVLVSGGAGFIGSHICVELLAQNYQVIVIDNLVNASSVSLQRVRQIAGKDLHFYENDVRDEAALDKIFTTHNIYAVIHLAGLKAVGESVAKPLLYYQNNLISTMTLIQVMQKHKCQHFVFSSSATVYGEPHKVPITEDFPLKATNPYGQTKLFCEEILSDHARSTDSFKVILLRYFNPIGAHKSGLIGENARGIPNNLLPFVCQVAVGTRDKLRVFGSDWPTPDGTGVRDYIHVVDLALGHVAALRKFEADETDNKTKSPEAVRVYNLGTGKGYSVLEIVEAMRRASGKAIPVELVDRRPGDIPTSYADCSKATQELGWTAVSSDVDTMCTDAWRFQSSNPQGYE